MLVCSSGFVPERREADANYHVVNMMQTLNLMDGEGFPLASLGLRIAERGPEEKA